MKNLPSLFGSLVFNDTVMREKLSVATYKTLKRTITEGKTLDLKIANSVAQAMKNWAIEKGATHYTHWFQPMTGITAEKHQSFISPAPDGNIIMKFSGKELIKGESDASSFPCGGIRATFEARGYTAWDPTSYAFIKDGVLCIPTAFCSYGGEVLDKKMPLLRSMDALNRHALRVLKLLGDGEVKRVISLIGCEQEYFLIDKQLFNKRKDLINCDRTLFGARPPKGQELEDHYFGVIKSKIADYMNELDRELWKMGVFAKTKHNEVAPSQYELTPIYETANIATDHNQLTMEVMKKVAEKHGYACLFHEKPFKDLNGNAKHNNWSLTTDTGINLFNPGNAPYDNLRFLLFLAAIIKAVDQNQALLRLSVASAGNDHRLGANEAPPTVVSIYLGDELIEVTDSLINGNDYSCKIKEEMETGVEALPHFLKDISDRNRTSPFAFTGNKFEFRMPGAPFSISEPNIIINTIVADALSDFADELEKADDVKKQARELVIDTLKKHRRIIYNGNNYSEQWFDEAKKRGLLNLKTTYEALTHYNTEQNKELFDKHNIFNDREFEARYQIITDNYNKTINIEALTMLDMANKDIIPAAEKYVNVLLQTVNEKKRLSGNIKSDYEISIINKMSDLLNELYNNAENLEKEQIKAENTEDLLEKAEKYCNNVLPAMKKVRCAADSLEKITDERYWPLPAYSRLLYSH